MPDTCHQVEEINEYMAQNVEAAAASEADSR
eukprot:SAG22_NODE_10014_length_558_cov_1.013072_2_plen_30_part_01